MLQKHARSVTMLSMKDHHVVSGLATEHSTSCTTEAQVARENAPHGHGSDCCDGHRDHHPTNHDRSSLLASMLPIFACALCPAHVGIWAQGMSIVGIGVVITETQHHVMLAVAIVAALLVCLVRFVRTRIVGPFVLTIIGCACLAGSDIFVEEKHLAPWLSIVVILGASLWQRHVERAAMHPRSHTVT